MKKSVLHSNEPSNVFQRRLSRAMNKELKRIDRVMKKRGFVRKNGKKFTEN